MGGKDCVGNAGSPYVDLVNRQPNMHQCDELLKVHNGIEASMATIRLGEDVESKSDFHATRGQRILQMGSGYTWHKHTPAKHSLISYRKSHMQSDQGICCNKQIDEFQDCHLWLKTVSNMDIRGRCE